MAKSKEPEVSPSDERRERMSSPDVTPEETEENRQIIDNKNTMLGDDRTTAEYTSEEK